MAEAELLYVDISSTALTVRFEVVQNFSSEPVYLLIWTTTPWTLPLNKAVYFSNSIKYSLVKISNFSGMYIIASDLIESLQTKLKVCVKIYYNFFFFFFFLPNLIKKK